MQPVKHLKNLITEEAIYSVKFLKLLQFFEVKFLCSMRVQNLFQKYWIATHIQIAFGIKEKYKISKAFICP